MPAGPSLLKGDEEIKPAERSTPLQGERTLRSSRLAGGQTDANQRERSGSGPDQWAKFHDVAAAQPVK